MALKPDSIFGLLPFWPGWGTLSGAAGDKDLDHLPNPCLSLVDNKDL